MYATFFLYSAPKEASICSTSGKLGPCGL